MGTDWGAVVLDGTAEDTEDTEGRLRVGMGGLVFFLTTDERRWARIGGLGLRWAS